ncbi:putative DNA binding domain-containing protein [Candidatus Pacearchaeota archaeon]|nr:putative DNA binding domain-containing protein [Candidatus Pacearchaeota archaeon]
MQTKELCATIEELKKLDCENECVEFKTNTFDLEKTGKQISALSNSACLKGKKYSYIVFGIDDKSHEIVGTKITIEDMKIGNENAENWLLRMLSPKIDFEIFYFSYKDKNIILFRIPAAKSTPVRFSNIKYIRVGSYLKILDDFPEKERKIWKITEGYSFEKDIALHGVEKEKIIELIDYVAFFELSKQPVSRDLKTILDKLSNSGIIIPEDNNLYSITNMGALLLANNLDNFKSLHSRRIRVILYRGKNKINAIKEFSPIKGYASGMSELIDYINNLLPQSEEIKKVLREEVKMYPPIILRELVPNALVHQDFGKNGKSPTIEIYSDRIEISNAGLPVIPLLRLIDENESRNEELAELMRKMFICEERGSGLDRVINSLEVYQLPALKFIPQTNSFKVIVYSSKTLRQMDNEDKVRACYQHCVLKHLNNEPMTNKSLRGRFNIVKENYPIASKIISNTLKEGLIKTIKKSEYIPFWVQ